MSCGDGNLNVRDSENAMHNPSSKRIARGIMELEVRLKRDMSENIFSANQKVLCELNKIQGRLFNVLGNHDSLLNDILMKVNDQGSCLDKLVKEQEQLRKKLEGFERIMSNNGSRDYIANQNGLQNHNRNFVNGRLNYDKYPKRPLFMPIGNLPRNNSDQLTYQHCPNPQFSSDKMWTTRGHGTFTSEDESDDDETEVEPLAPVTLVEKISKLVLQEETSKIEYASPESDKKFYPDQPNLIDLPSAVPVSNGNNTDDPSSPTSQTVAILPTASNVGRGLSGGFGNFRRGKPATTTNTKISESELPKAEFKNVENSRTLNAGVSESNFTSSLNVRPLTLDELEVLSKTGTKNYKSSNLNTDKGYENVFSSNDSRRSLSRSSSFNPFNAMPKFNSAENASLGYSYNNAKKKQNSRKM